LAGLAVGFWKDRRELEEKWKVGRRYEPQMNEEERARLHSRWRKAVKRAKGWERDAN
ncbi:MAG: glycerol kinase, partial [Acidobacteria bacterium]|nr:glycerol kinase [Acidobacteriota bacterium]